MKRVLPLALALVLACSLTFPASAAAFADVSDSSPFAAAIAWAVDKGVTNGTSPTTFSPSQTCTTSHILTFLWRSQGRPGDGGNERAAVRAWAEGLGIDTRDLSAPCTRAAAVEYIWKACGSPQAETGGAFADVPAGAAYGQAVAWAVERGVTNGTGEGKFSPDQTCTRGQIAAFLYRAMGEGSGETPTETSAPTLTNGTPVSEANVKALLNELRAKYPTETTFTGYRTPSAAVNKVASSYTRAKGGTTSTTDGCGGWAAMVSDYIFGTNGFPARKVSIQNARPGDIAITLNNDGKLTHVSIITVNPWHDSENEWWEWKTCDANFSGPNRIAWDNRGTQYDDGYGYHFDIWTRYPD